MCGPFTENKIKFNWFNPLNFINLINPGSLCGPFTRPRRIGRQAQNRFLARYSLDCYSPPYKLQTFNFIYLSTPFEELPICFFLNVINLHYAGTSVVKAEVRKFNFNLWEYGKSGQEIWPEIQAISRVFSFLVRNTNQFRLIYFDIVAVVVSLGIQYQRCQLIYI